MVQDDKDLTQAPETPIYEDDQIVHLDWREHLRLRPGMYIGKLGDGTNFDDGIYILIKEVVDNSIDEYFMGFGKQIDITVDDTTVTVRDFGRGIPLGSVRACVGQINTGGKYQSDGAFKKTVGLNGVGVKAVNALSEKFTAISYRDGQMKRVDFEKGLVINDLPVQPTDQPNGTFITFTPDAELFKDFKFRREFIEPLLKNYSYLNTGLTLTLNGDKFHSRGGLLDLLKENVTKDPLYPPIRLKGEEIEVTLTHVNQYGEEYYTFVNGQHTIMGGTHQAALKDAVSRTLKEYYGKNFEAGDVRNGMVAALSIRVDQPLFESQTKTKLTSRDISADGPTVAKFVGDFIKKDLDNYLHRNLDVADIILKKIQDSERERKAMAGVTKAAREKAKKINLHNKKLLDCNVHLNDAKGDEDKKLASSIFLTEGDSATGSITTIRDVETQAVFSLRGKPLNTYGLTQKVVYTNDEFNLLQAALNIEDGLDGLRYNNVIIATDADVDGMHIRLLLLTFFLQFFPDLVKKGHVYVLQTPLFRVRNKKTSKRRSLTKGKNADKPADDVFYCYTDQERLDAIARLGDNAEITRFKGLGEISPEEFAAFIGPDMRADRVKLRKEDDVADVLKFYMGQNTPQRQNFIINNLVVEE